MVTHIVIFTWLPGTTVQQVDAVRRALDHLAASLTGSAVIMHGQDLRYRDTGGDYALVATFPDRAAWDAYQANPQHKAVVRDVITPIQAARLTAQI